MGGILEETQKTGSSAVDDDTPCGIVIDERRTRAALAPDSAKAYRSAAAIEANSLRSVRSSVTCPAIGWRFIRSITWLNPLLDESR